jgi:uncharacterized protein (DUF362 family)
MKLKSVLVYGIILVLCIAAAVGYLATNRQPAEAAGAVEASSAAVDKTGDTGNAEPAPTAAAEPGQSAAVEEKTAAAIDPQKQGHIAEVMKKSSAEPDPNPVVGIGRGEDYAKVTEEAVQNAGGLEGIVKKGDTVIIKPNICTFAASDSGKTTDYRTVQKIVDLVSALGASKIIVAEGTIAGDAFSSVFLSVNHYDLIKGAELLDLNKFNKEDCYELKPERSLTGKAIFIPKVYMDADVVINVAKLKTHFQPEAFVSLSLKNCYGVPPGQIYGLGSKDGLHMLGLKESIVDINRIRKPDFSVIEGIVGGEGYGPLSNDPVQSNIILAGKDPVALDTAAITFMGFTPDQSPHLKLAGEEHLGISDLSKIKVVGAELEKIKMHFRAYDE